MAQAIAKLKNTQIDSKNFAGDVVVYWVSLDKLIAARLEKDPVVFTGVADNAVAAVLKSQVPPGMQIAGLWAKSAFAYVGLEPKPLDPWASANCCGAEISGRLHWPASAGGPKFCSALPWERTVFVAPPELTQPEPPLFGGAPRHAKAVTSIKFATDAPQAVGHELVCEYTFGIGARMAVDVVGGAISSPGKGVEVTVLEFSREGPSLVLPGAKGANLLGEGKRASSMAGRTPGSASPNNDPGRQRSAVGVVRERATGVRQAAPAVTPNWGGAAAAGGAATAQKPAPTAEATSAFGQAAPQFGGLPATGARVPMSAASAAGQR